MEALKSVKIPKSITKEEVNKLPLDRYRGPIELIKTPEAVPAAIDALRKETILGFDTESRPSFKKGTIYPPSLVQLAGAERVYLFQLQHLGSLEGLIEIFKSPKIKKVGIAIQDDVKKLRELEDFQPKQFIDISKITAQMNMVNSGLRNLAAILLGVRISKSSQLSNWSLPELSKSQICYAATDAWVSRKLYARLIEIGEQRDK